MINAPFSELTVTGPTRPTYCLISASSPEGTTAKLEMEASSAPCVPPCRPLSLAPPPSRSPLSRAGAALSPAPTPAPALVVWKPSPQLRVLVLVAAAPALRRYEEIFSSREEN